MKIEYSAKQAIKVSRNNAARAWGGTADSAAVRLTRAECLRLRHKPKFLLDRTAPVFTIGSCFARNVENTMLSHNLPLLLKHHGVPAEEYQSWDEVTGRGGGVGRGQLSRGAFNKYSVHSMSHELKRVLLDEQCPDEGLIQLSGDLWFDPHASMLRNGPFQATLTNRKRIEAAMKEIRNARVMFMTLGLTETWIDAASGLAMNTHPGANWLMRMGDRFHFVDYGFDGIMSEMVGMIELVRETCHRDMRFIVTVSPVPLASTFKDADVIVANSGSKATLRAVAEELYRRYDYVDYFPSYEIVMNTARPFAWHDDQLHVSAAVVKEITETFVGLYYA
ncbi:MAG TPA: GSCFA domain-containing protein [Arenibaculum sp.]|nr:GSCFA domain-containing protein [Arenibaculum sp.]